MKSRSGAGFFSGAAIGGLGGLVGLGGAEFRLPVLVGMFQFPTLEAVIINKAMSLVVVVFSLLFRTTSVSVVQLLSHWPIVVNLLMGSLVGAWWAAGHAMRIRRAWLDRFVLVLLVALALFMMAEAGFDLLPRMGNGGGAEGLGQWLQGVVAGWVIGVVAAFLGVAGGELLIPTIVLLYGVDIKLAGSLSLMVSLPTMVVGFARYRAGGAFSVLGREQRLLIWMGIGSILGAWGGSLLLGLFSPRWLMMGLGIILLLSAFKVFQHSR